MKVVEVRDIFILVALLVALALSRPLCAALLVVLALSRPLRAVHLVSIGPEQASLRCAANGIGPEQASSRGMVAGAGPVQALFKLGCNWWHRPWAGPWCRRTTSRPCAGQWSAT